jgi:hypothetical protein
VDAIIDRLFLSGAFACQRMAGPPQSMRRVERHRANNVHGGARSQHNDARLRPPRIARSLAKVTARVPGSGAMAVIDELIGNAAAYCDQWCDK